MPKTVPNTAAAAILRAFACSNHTRPPTGNRHRHASLAATVAACLTGLLAGAPVHAIGLGELQVQSGLGQALRATIRVFGSDPANRPANCYSARLSTADGGFIVSPRVALVGSASAGMLSLATSVSLAEPALSLMVEVACGDTVRKEFMLLLDPPLAFATPAVSDQQTRAPRLSTTGSKAASAALSTPDDMPGITVVATPAAARAVSSAPASPAVVARQVRARAMAAPAVLAQRPSATLPAAAAPAPRAARNVLHMSARASGADADLINAIGLRLALADRLGGSAGTRPATGVAVDAASLAADRAARARFVEALQGSTGATDTAQATEQRLQQLQTKTRLLEAEAARLRQLAQQEAVARTAEANTGSNTLLLAGLIALLVASLAAIAWLMRRMQHLQRRNRDWDWEESVLAADARAARTDPAAEAGSDAALSLEEEARAESAARAALHARADAQARELRRNRAEADSRQPLDDSFWESTPAPVVPSAIRSIGKAAAGPVIEPVIKPVIASVAGPTVEATSAPVMAWTVEPAAVAPPRTDAVPLTDTARVTSSIEATATAVRRAPTPAQQPSAQPPTLAMEPSMLQPAAQSETVARPFLPDLAFPDTPAAPLEFTTSANLPASGVVFTAPALSPVMAAPLPPIQERTPAASPGNLQFAEIRVQSTSPEEISDIMQEAEFWLSLHDLERAAEVLEPYATYEQAGSPLPWLYLFDLYRDLGWREKYDSLRDRFQRIFNGKALTWDQQKLVSPDTPQRGIEDVPHVALKLTTLWQSDQVLPYLERLLIDDRDGTRAGFDLAIYKEIMFLILLAYELQQAKQYLKPALGTPAAPMPA